MITGDMPLTATESMLQRLRTRVVLSRRQSLDETWRYDLLSPFWRLYVNNRDGAFITVRGKKLELPGGELIAIPAWIPFQTGLRRPVDQDYVHFYLEGLPQNWLRRLFRQPVVCSRDDGLQWLLAEWGRDLADAERGVTHFFRTGALVQTVMARLWSNLPAAAFSDVRESVAASSSVQPALAALEVRLSDPPTNRELAGLCRMSEDHFVRCFKGAVGLTPAQYGLGRRLDVAAEWLVQSERRIDDIAEQTGFTDRFHFTRTFKVRLGMPPAEYRRQHRL